MCPKATARFAAGLVLLCTAAVSAQVRGGQTRLDWRHIGNSAIELGLPSVATGPVDRVWYSEDGSALYARTRSGRTFVSNDLEQWRPVADSAMSTPSDATAISSSPPEPGARARSQGARVYGFGRNAFRSDDGGVTWTNITAYKGNSILGAPISDVAISPRDADDIVASNAAGLWHSTDGGLSWTGLNGDLPNLPVRRLYALPAGMHGLEISLAIDGSPELEWAPGEKTAWRVGQDSTAQREQRLKRALSDALGAEITAVAEAGDTLYAGSSSGRLWTSLDRGATWGPAWDTPDAGAVQAIFVDSKDSRIALAALGARLKPLPNGAKQIHVLRTMNAGLFWDDATANLPDVAAHGITADRASGAVYVATDAGVFFGNTDMGSAGRTGAWSPIGAGLPDSAAMDVKLDAGANQLYVAIDGYGVYATMAPHRMRDIRVVNAADYSSRPAAPGSLLSVLGTKVAAAHAGDSTVPVLAAGDTASQIQVPFDVKGQKLALILDAPAGQIAAGLPLRSVSPGIFVDPDGTPMLLDGDSGVMLDALTTAHSGSRVQILATGLGRVEPDWPAGTPAPLADPPRVIATVHAYLDQTPVEVTRAVLASGYIGFYLVEIQLPRIVNAGPAELYIEAEGQPSNRVRLYIEP